jgi:hypothetical protein
MKRRSAVAAAVAALLPALLGGAAGAAPLNVKAEGANGIVRETEPGRTCAEDGAGSYRHFAGEAALAPGRLSNLAGNARTTLDVHYDGPAGLSRGGPNAFLLGSESHLTLSNQRGSVQVLLRKGTCAEPGLAFDGSTATLGTGQGTWSSSTGDLIGSGAYRQITGSGTFGLTSELNPGADNAWSVTLDGNIQVLQPDLTVKVEKTYWGNLGLDYLSRIVTVVYRIGNTGPGDSFGSLFTGASGGSGVKPCGDIVGVLKQCPDGGAPAQSLGDLLSCSSPSLPSTCDTELITVRYHLALLGPCDLVLLGCEFESTIQTSMPDALDTTSTKSKTVTVRAPDLPPPL